MNLQQELSQAEIRRSQLQAAVDAPEAQRRALQRELDIEAAHISSLEKQRAAAQVEAALKQARQVGEGNDKRLKAAHAALDAIAAQFAAPNTAALDDMREAAADQRAALDAALGQVEAQVEEQASGHYSASFSDQRKLSDKIQSQVRAAASTVPRALTARDAIGLWVQAASPDEKRLRQAVAFLLTGIMIDPSPDWRPAPGIDPYRG